MLPLAAISLHLYLIARLILHSTLAAQSLSAALFFVFVALWFLLPRLKHRPGTSARTDT